MELTGTRMHGNPDCGKKEEMMVGRKEGNRPVLLFGKAHQDFHMDW